MLQHLTYECYNIVDLILSKYTFGKVFIIILSVTIFCVIKHQVKLFLFTTTRLVGLAK